MKIYDKEILEKAVKESHDWTELCQKLGRIRSSHIKQSIERNIKKYSIDNSHFDSYFKIKQKGLKNLIEKECPVCKKIFITKKNSKETTYCSWNCSNSLNLGKRHSVETKEKISNKLKGRIKWNYDINGQFNFEKQLFSKNKRVIKNNKSCYEKECGFCHEIFYTHQPKRIFCNRKCQMKGLWLRKDYRNNIVSKINENVKSGKHSGWKSRNILSYPEKFFKKVLELNGFKYKFIINYAIKKRDLQLDCDACYFLDFYFPELRLDLEIDGKQHKHPERKESDKNRDLSLNKNGYLVYRIEWKSLNKQEGKDFIKKEIEKFLEFIKNLRASVKAA